MNDADVKNILGLKLPTDPRWVNLAEKSMAEILTDHAFCEQKAATTCISLIQKFSTLENGGISGRCWQNCISADCIWVNSERTNM